MCPKSAVGFAQNGARTNLTRLGFGKNSAPAPFDTKVRLSGVSKRRLHRVSSKSDLWEAADSSQISGAPLWIRGPFFRPPLEGAQQTWPLRHTRCRYSKPFKPRHACVMSSQAHVGID